MFLFLLTDLPWLTQLALDLQIPDSDLGWTLTSLYCCSELTLICLLTTLTLAPPCMTVAWLLTTSLLSIFTDLGFPPDYAYCCSSVYDPGLATDLLPAARSFSPWLTY